MPKHPATSCLRAAAVTVFMTAQLAFATLFTYSGSPVAIPDNNVTGVDVPLNVSGLANSITDVNVQIGGSTCSGVAGATGVGIDHTYVGDVVLTLISPTGQQVTLANQAGGSGNGGNNFCQVYLDDQSGNLSIQDVTSGQAPFTGSYTPSQPLSAFVGLNPNGTWKLRAVDLANNDTGSVRAFSLHINAVNQTAYSYSGSPIAIPDNNPAGVNIPISISGFQGTLSKLSFVIGGSSCTANDNDPNVGLAHTWVGDLVLKLTSPSGTRITLVNRPGNDSNAGNNFCQTILDDNGGGTPINSVVEAGAPYSGSYTPAAPLSTFNGEDPNGTWILNVADYGAGDTGVMRSFSLRASTVSGIDTSRFLQQSSFGTLIHAVFSPDGTRIASCGGAGAYLWDVESRTMIRRFGGHSKLVRCVAFSPDGHTLLTGSWDRTAKLWDVDTGTLIRTFYGHEDEINTVCFSTDGTRIVTGAGHEETGGIAYDTTAKLWDVNTGSMLQTFSGHTKAVLGVAMSADGSLVATGSDDFTAKLWNASTGALIQTYTGHTNGVSSVDITPDGQKVLTGSFDFTARLWNANTAAVLQTYTSSGDFVRSAVFSNDTNSILVAETNTGKLFDTATAAVLQTYPTGGQSAFTAHFSTDESQVITTARSGVISIWNKTTAVISAPDFSGHTDRMGSVAFTPDRSKIVSGHSDGKVRVWDTRTGEQLLTINAHVGLVSSVEVSPDGTRIASGSWDNRVKVFNLATGASVWSQNELINVRDVEFSADGTRIAVALGVNNELFATNPPCAKVRDASTGALVNTYKFGNPSTFPPAYPYDYYVASSVAFSPDGQKLLTGYWSGDAFEWNVNTAARLGVFSHSLGELYTVTYSPDGTKVATGGEDAVIKIWNASSRTILNSLVGHSQWLHDLEFSSDGSQLLSAAGNDTNILDETARLWDVASGNLLRTFSSHGEDVQSASFSCVTGSCSEAPRVLTGSRDGTARIWELSPPRAVIVAGGGNFSGNSIAQQTNDLSAYAYKTLRARGYNDEDIQYLSSFANRDADGNGTLDVDTTSSLENLEAALTGPFATGAGRLSVFMLDHGYRTSGFMAFRLNPTQALSTTRLKNWLDTLQTSNLVDVTLVADCCYSGQFVQDCQGAPAGRKRTIIASTTSTAEAVFLPPPDLSSFMQTFLSSAYMGNSFGESWRAGSRFFQQFPVANQVPQINDGSTSTTNADRDFFGASWAYGVQSTLDINQFFPAFDTWTSNTVVGPADPVTISCIMLPNQEPVSVSVAVRPPAPSVLSGDPVTTLPRIALTRDLFEPRLWSATVPGSGTFSQTGGYSLSFLASFSNSRVSNPVYGSVSVNAGPDPDQTPMRAILAIGNSGNAPLDTALSNQGPLAYRAMLDRFQSTDGIKHPEWIDYSSAFTDPPRDSVASSAGVLGSISSFGSSIPGACRLYVHLIGTSDATAGRVRLATGDYLTTSALKTALDAWQSGSPADRVAIVSVDAPGSGAFLAGLANPSYKRITLTSGRAGDNFIQLSTPVLTSFSQKYLGAAAQGNSILGSFTAARNFFQSFLRYFLSTPIQPQMDSNGDGLFNTADFATAIASSTYLGPRYAFAGDEAAGLPFVLDVTTTQTANAGGSVSYTAALLEGITPSRVFAQLVAPDTGESAAPVTGLPEVEFTRTAPTDWTWTTTFAAPSLAGSWSVNVYAEYPDGTSTKLSEPAFTGLVVNGSPESPDIYEVAPYFDNSYSTTQNYVLPGEGTPQAHTLHDATDEDWGITAVAALDTAGAPFFTPYSLQLTNRQLPAGSSLYVEIWDLSNPATDFPDLDFTFSGALGDPILYCPFMANGFQTVVWRITRLGGSPTEGANYSVWCGKDTGDNNGIAINIGGNRSSVGWPAQPSAGGTEPRGSATFVGYEVYRMDCFNETRTLITPTPLPQLIPGCACPTTLLPSSSCMEFIDDPVPSPVPVPGSTPYPFAWEVQRLYSDNSRQVHARVYATMRFDGTGTGSAFCISRIVNWSNYADPSR